MGPMIAAGGFSIASEHVKELEEDLNSLCDKTGLPNDEIFKWSPKKKNSNWMYGNLKGNDRINFQVKIIDLLKNYDCKVIFVAEDKNCNMAMNESTSSDIDVTNMLMERVDSLFHQQSTHGIIVMDRPGGGSKDHDSFLANCLSTIQNGTTVKDINNIILSVMCLPNHYTRLLQAADLVVSATLSYVSGNETYTLEIIENIKPLLHKESQRIGGVGVKLHPDFKFANLYHWLFDDTHFWKNSCGNPLPLENRNYSQNANS